jgi:hypothetical protein
VTYGNNLFVGVGDGATLTSTDGTTWTEKSTDSEQPRYGLNSVTYGNNKFVAAGSYWEDYTDAIFTSPDGVTWTAQTSWTTSQFRLSSVTYCNNQFVAVGSKIFSSPDGETWTEKYAGTKSNINSVTYGNNQFVAVGDSGTVLTSPDGTSWTTQSSGTRLNLNSVTYGNNQFIAVGASTILTSPDGTTWTDKSSGTKWLRPLLNSVVYGNNQFVMVGENGTILVSKVDNQGAIHHRIATHNIGRIQISVSNNFISATVPSALSSRQLLVQLFNVAGKAIYFVEARNENGILRIPIKGFSKGAYIIRINDGKGTNVFSQCIVSR